MFDWNSLRYFLATARAGSTVAAARTMRVNQSTVSRRITALEDALGVMLFDRLVTGYELTSTGREILQAAQRAELEISGILQVLEIKSHGMKEAIRVTTNETIADLFLTPALPEFAALHPNIRVDVIVSSRWHDIERGEADVALRAARQLKTGRLSVTNLSPLPWAIYCSRGYVADYGFPTCAEELPQHRIVGVDGSLAAVAGFDWLEKVAGEEATVARTNSLPNLMTAIRAGLGIGALPCVQGDRDAELVRCIGPIPELESSLWLIARTRFHAEPSVSAFCSFIMSKAPAVRLLLQTAGASLGQT